VGCWRCQLTDWFCGKHPLGNGLTAFAKGEFKVDIRDDGDFGDARKAYVGLEDFFVESLLVSKLSHKKSFTIPSIFLIVQEHQSPMTVQVHFD
jgi:hypothetical protein